MSSPSSGLLQDSTAWSKLFGVGGVSDPTFAKREPEFITPRGTSYSPHIAFDMLNRSDVWTDFSEAYLELPLTVTAQGGTFNANHGFPIVALKDSVLSLFHGVTVTANGTPVVTEQDSLMFSNHLRLALENDEDWLKACGPDLMFARDRPEEGVAGLTSSAQIVNPSIAKYTAAPDVGDADDPGNHVSPAYNKGFHQRNRYLHEASLSRTGADQHTVNGFPFIARIPLKHIHDFFTKLGLTWGVGWKFQFFTNFGNTTTFRPLAIGSSVAATPGPGNAPAFAGTLSVGVTQGEEPRLHYSAIELTPEQMAAHVAAMAQGVVQPMVFKSYTLHRESSNIAYNNNDKVAIKVPSRQIDTRAVYIMAYPNGQVDSASWPSVLVTGANGITNLGCKVNGTGYHNIRLETLPQQYEMLKGLMAGTPIRSESLISYSDFVRTSRIMAFDLIRFRKVNKMPSAGIDIVVEGQVESQGAVQLVVLVENEVRADLVMGPLGAQVIVRGRVEEPVA